MQDLSQRDVKPTVEVIRQMADHLRDTANDVSRIADRMLVDETFDRLPEVMSEISNLFNALRLDLLITRPIREYERGKDESRSK